MKNIRAFLRISRLIIRQKRFLAFLDHRKAFLQKEIKQMKAIANNPVLCYRFHYDARLLLMYDSELNLIRKLLVFAAKETQKMTEKCPECGSDNFRSGTDPETGKVGHDCRICGHSWTQREAGLP